MRSSATAMITAEQLLAMPGLGRAELIGGALHRMEPAGAQHGRLASEIDGLIRDYRRQHGGLSFAAETGFQIGHDPDTVRAPDAAYVSAARAREVGEVTGYRPGPPDLAVEVVSAGDGYTAVHEKALAWLAAGARVVLVVDPAAGRVSRYRAGQLDAFAGQEPVDCVPAMAGFAPSADALLGRSE